MAVCEVRWKRGGGVTSDVCHPLIRFTDDVIAIQLDSFLNCKGISLPYKLAPVRGASHVHVLMANPATFPNQDSLEQQDSVDSEFPLPPFPAQLSACAVLLLPFP